MIITQMPNVLNMTLYMKQGLMYLIMCWATISQWACLLSVMSHAGEEEASKGAAVLISVDTLIFMIVGMTVFIAGHET
jgi:hypothetical protein